MFGGNFPFWEHFVIFHFNWITWKWFCRWSPLGMTFMGSKNDQKEKLNLGECCLNLLACRSDLSRPLHLLSGGCMSVLMRGPGELWAGVPGALCIAHPLQAPACLMDTRCSVTPSLEWYFPLFDFDRSLTVPSRVSVMSEPRQSDRGKELRVQWIP